MLLSELCTAHSQTGPLQFSTDHCGSRDNRKSCIHLLSHASISHSCIRQTDAFGIHRLMLWMTWQGTGAACYYSIFKFSFISSTCWLLPLVPENQEWRLEAARGLSLPPRGTTGGEANYRKSSLCYMAGGVTVLPKAWWMCGPEGDPKLCSVWVWLWPLERTYGWHLAPGFHIFNSHLVLLFLPINTAPNRHRGFVKQDDWSHPCVIDLGIKSYTQVYD